METVNTYAVKKSFGDLLNVCSYLQVESSNGLRVSVVHVNPTSARGEHVVELLVLSGSFSNR
jgi:hypothetical protein